MEIDIEHVLDKAQRSDGLESGPPTSPDPKFSIRPPAPIHLTLRDDTIKCVCPSGTTRHFKDLAFLRMDKQHGQWSHLSCKPFATAVPAETAERLKSLVNASASGNEHDLETILMRFLGHTENDKQRLLLKHFTSAFRCDGPCKGSKPLSDFIVCKKCCAWQHKQCQLYGDPHDRGGPVCNRCYTSFIIHREEIVEWQRSRLLQAVREGFMYLNNPENLHQKWRRKWLLRWLSRFFANNQGVYHEYIAAKNKARRVAAAREYYNRVQTRPHTGQSHDRNQSIRVATTDVTNEHGAEEVRRSGRRKQPERRKAPTKPLLEGDDDTEGDYEMTDADEIAVAPKRKGAHQKTRSESRTAHSNSKRKRVSGTRRASSSASQSLLMKKGKFEQSRTRAPRKSAPSTGWHKLVVSDSATEEADDEVEDSELRLLEHRRADARSKISCRCLDKPKLAADGFKCRDCHANQHYDCADDIQDGLSVLCNFCFNRSLSPLTSQSTSRAMPAQLAYREEPVGAARPTPAQSTSRTQQMEQPTEQYNPALRDEVNHLCATVLWREYCSIPSPDDEEVPTFQANASAPADWLVECQERLMGLLSSAGREQTAAYLTPALAAWPRQDKKIVQALRDLAREEIFRGSYRKKRKHLGVVLEVLRLEEKGRVWKG